MGNSLPFISDYYRREELQNHLNNTVIFKPQTISNHSLGGGGGNSHPNLIYNFIFAAICLRSTVRPHHIPSHLKFSF